MNFWIELLDDEQLRVCPKYWIVCFTNIDTFKRRFRNNKAAKEKTFNCLRKLNTINDNDDEKCDENEVIEMVQKVFCNAFEKSKYRKDRILKGTIVCNLVCEWSIWDKKSHDTVIETITKYIDSSFSQELWFTIYSYLTDKDMRFKWDELLKITVE